ncbi:MAG: hypothetical protein GY751_06755 [Bacteroidetes bacterium]|nr:hypothetical protein [Bacteroidota bacterium]
MQKSRHLLIALAIIFFSAISCTDSQTGNTGEQDQEVAIMANCTGPCEATYTASDFKNDKCPDPCDPDIIKTLRKAAKKGARLKAIDNCMSLDLDCICANGTYTKVAETCETIVDSTASYCHYKVKWKYKGTCETVL